MIAGASSCDSSSEVSDEGYKSSQGSKKLAVAAEEDEMKVAQKVDEEEDFSGGNISPGMKLESLEVVLMSGQVSFFRRSTRV